MIASVKDHQYHEGHGGARRGAWSGAWRVALPLVIFNVNDREFEV